MSTTLIVREVERETAAEIERLLASADQRAEAMVAAARAEVQARVEAAVGRAEPAVRAEARRRANAARLRLNEQRLAVAVARAAAVRAAAAERLAAIAAGAEPERWSAALGRLTREALGLVGKGASVRIRHRDAGALTGLVNELGGVLELVADEAPAGVVVTSADGRVEVDATVTVRLDRAWVRLAEVTAARLELRT
jgi:vacuolar-type H+-ATPase subunit E/Vma4